MYNQPTDYKSELQSITIPIQIFFKIVWFVPTHLQVCSNTLKEYEAGLCKLVMFLSYKGPRRQNLIIMFQQYRSSRTLTGMVKLYQYI